MSVVQLMNTHRLSDHPQRRRTDRQPQAPANPAAAIQLWPAWRSLDDWDEVTERELGGGLGDLLLTLWAVHRLGGTGDGEELLSDVLQTRSGAGLADEVLEDMASVCFSLGAAWAVGRHNAGACLTRQQGGR